MNKFEMTVKNLRLTILEKSTVLKTIIHPSNESILLFQKPRTCCMYFTLSMLFIEL